jgi:hypothetical protein
MLCVAPNTRRVPSLAIPRKPRRMLASIEPNAWGADAVRGAFWAALQEHAKPIVT